MYTIRKVSLARKLQVDFFAIIVSLTCTAISQFIQLQRIHETSSRMSIYTYIAILRYIYTESMLSFANFKRPPHQLYS